MVHLTIKIRWGPLFAVIVSSLLLTGCVSMMPRNTPPGNPQQTDPGPPPQHRNQTSVPHCPDCEKGTNNQTQDPHQHNKMKPHHEGLDESQGKPPQKGKCPVTGQPLGSMGPPIPVEINGKKVFVCCQGCVRKLRQNPEKYLPSGGTTNEVVKTKPPEDFHNSTDNGGPSHENSNQDQKPSQEGKCPVTGEPLGSMGTPVPVEVNGKKIFVCCEGCVETLRKNPEKYLSPTSTTNKDEACDQCKKGIKETGPATAFLNLKDIGSKKQQNDQNNALTTTNNASAPESVTHGVAARKERPLASSQSLFLMK